METGPDLEQRSHPPPGPRHSPRRRRDSGQDLEDRALAGTVPTQDAERLARPDGEADIAERPHVGETGVTWANEARRSSHYRLAGVRAGTDHVALAHVIELDDVHSGLI